ncbi:MAG: mandelate racemase/muconate lactonizing enzyme family protein [Armatimonadetes bacterium]|nr:mandelate racemase/muconate lactonizing enzyme family protein [Armatimonadota bacterium]
MKITRIRAWQVFIPYEPPLGPYMVRTGPATGARSLIVRVDTDEGLSGWGEGRGSFTPDPEALLKSLHPADLEGHQKLMVAAGIANGVRSAVDMALWDVVGKAAGIPLCRLLGGVLREEVDFCACMGLKDPEACADTARAYMERWGFRHLKTKAGRDVQEDLRIAAAVMDVARGRATLRPDANAGYSPEAADPLLRGMKDLGVTLFEDPCSIEHLDEMARFRREIGLPLAINMGVRDAAAALRILSAGAGDVLMPDFPVVGSLLGVRKVAAVAEAAGVPCLMHCAHDMGLKTAAVAHVAAATPSFSGPNDTTYHGLADDILTERLVFREGRIRVPMAPGLGVAVDEEKVTAYSVA